MTGELAPMKIAGCGEAADAAATMTATRKPKADPDARHPHLPLSKPTRRRHCCFRR